MRLNATTGFPFALVAFGIATRVTAAQLPRELHLREVFDTTLSPGSAHDYTLPLASGGSANIVILQEGVDVVIDLRGPDGNLISTFDSPNGRNGDEPVEILSTKGGLYSIRVRPFSAREPVGQYRLQVIAVRSAPETAAMMRARQLARDSATKWLATRSVPLDAPATVSLDARMAPLDALVARANVIGLGEATHGSREFGDLRLSLTKRLITNNGFRIVGIEASASRYELIARYVAGEAQSYPAGSGPPYNSWIGSRTQRALIAWVRGWNLAHPRDRVRIVGLDAQDNQTSRDTLKILLNRAYGSDIISRLAPMFQELAAADSQTAVFGDSRVDSVSRRSIMEVVAMLYLDEPALLGRLGATDLQTARDAAIEVAQFADFNSRGSGALSHSRDWYMAVNLMGAIERAAPGTKAVFWAHNAHVAHHVGQSIGSRTSGAWLREMLGCGYAALGTAFGEGSFVAQIPNDPTDRLAISTLPLSPTESIDAVLAGVGPQPSLASWGCAEDSASVPTWLRNSHPMHWVGGLFTPGSASGDALRAFNLLEAFDAVAYIPHVTADEMPANRPLIPARKR